MSDKINSEVVIVQLKSLFCKRTNIPSTSVMKVYLWSQPPHTPPPPNLPPVRGVAATDSPSGAPPKDNGPPNY